MKIHNISTYFLRPIINNNKTTVSFALQPTGLDTVSFKKQKELTPEKRFERATDIAKSFSKDRIMHMDNFDQEHLEGIQYGLKSFEGMNFKEIYFLLSNMGELCMPLVRDCSGMCPVCAVNGLPKNRTNKNLIHRTDFEDFSNFTHDLKTICRRLGFDLEESAVSKQPPIARMLEYKPVISLFYDSDCKDVYLEDKNGKVHEFPELNKMMYESSGIKGIFDTAGWVSTDTKVQKRMEALAEYYNKPEHQKEIEQINISLNTYHGIMDKANYYKNKGDKEGYNRLKASYVKNIANAIYTFTPMIDFEGYHILSKAFDYNEDSQFDDYKIPVLEKLTDEVFEALKKRYKDDLKNKNYKFVKNEDDISDLMYKIKSKSGNIDDRFTPSARKNIFSDIPVKQSYLFFNNTTLDSVLEETHMMIDMNGKIYFRNDYQVFETDRSFNFKNKNKETKQIYPLPFEKIISVKDKDFIEPD